MQVAELGPRPRPILNSKEELFAAELKAIRELLSELVAIASGTEALSRKEHPQLPPAHEDETGATDAPLCR